MLLQAYDFLVLYDRYGCRLQMGGSDQWGNILAGADLIRRLRGEAAATQGKLAHGLVFPLVTTSAGVKFGKTEAGTVWLDPKLTSPFRFYQFWINTDDRDVVHYLKFFTWLTREEIAELEETLASAPQERAAQRRLAREVTRMLHGETELAKAERASAVLFGEEISELQTGGRPRHLRRRPLGRDREDAARRRGAAAGRPPRRLRARPLQGRGAAGGAGGRHLPEQPPGGGGEEGRDAEPTASPARFSSSARDGRSTGWCG